MVGMVEYVGVGVDCRWYFEYSSDGVGVCCGRYNRVRGVYTVRNIHTLNKKMSYYNQLCARKPTCRVCRVCRVSLGFPKSRRK